MGKYDVFSLFKSSKKIYIFKDNYPGTFMLFAMQLIYFLNFIHVLKPISHTWGDLK